MRIPQKVLDSGGRTAERKLDVENALLGVMPGKFAELSSDGHGQTGTTTTERQRC